MLKSLVKLTFTYIKKLKFSFSSNIFYFSICPQKMEFISYCEVATGVVQCEVWPCIQTGVFKQATKVFQLSMQTLNQCGQFDYRMNIKNWLSKPHSEASSNVQSLMDEKPTPWHLKFVLKI